MTATLNHREKMYRAYMEFFDVAERKRRWHPLHDIPWDKLDYSKNKEENAICVETFCGVELYVPDYTSNGFNLTRSIFGHAWFQANWGYEESKHGLTFREYLIRSGLRTEEQYAEFEQKILAKVWNLPFKTRRQMTCYGALQESATFLIYRSQLEKARQNNNEVLEKIYYYISKDESAHMGFYIKVLQFEMEEDREGTLADLAHVIYHFQMPGVGLIPEYEERLTVKGVGITSQQFLQRGIFPLLKATGTSRREMVKILHQKKSRSSKVDVLSLEKVSSAVPM